MIVFVENRAVNQAAIVGINTEFDSKSLKITQSDSLLKVVEVEFCIVPVLELANGTKITMSTQISRETLSINESELLGAASQAARLMVLLAVIESQLPPLHFKVAQKAAKFVNQLTPEF